MGHLLGKPPLMYQQLMRSPTAVGCPSTTYKAGRISPLTAGTSDVQVPSFPRNILRCMLFWQSKH